VQGSSLRVNNTARIGASRLGACDPERPGRDSDILAASTFAAGCRAPAAAERHSTMSRAFEDITRPLPDRTSGEKAQFAPGRGE
jgi:hypothetical protein